jgi:exonuclease SbcC
MKIVLTRLVLTNFKGIRSLDTSFQDVTNVYGANATGKTTLQDGFLWLLFDKDSTDRKDFEIKTLDENNQPYHRLSHEVVGHFLIDGVETVLRKEMREKWTKPRGSKDEVFDGHETAYFWNDVPLKKTEYQAKINALVNETTFKLLTNPLYFNQGMKWQERRAMLLQIAGEISNDQVVESMANLNNKTEVGIIINALNIGKSLTEYQRELANKKKKIKDELELVPPRIDEAKRMLPDELDYNGITAELAAKQQELARVEDLLQNQSKAEKERQDRLGDLHAKKQGLSRQMLDIEFNCKEEVRSRSQQRVSALNDAKNDLVTKNNTLLTLAKKKELLLSDIEDLKRQQKDLRDAWTRINAETITFDENEFSCPTCKRAFEVETIESKKEELTGNFNKSKSQRLEANVKKGKELGSLITRQETELANIDNRILSAQADVESAKQLVTVLNDEHVRLSETEETEVQKAINSNADYLRAKADRDACETELATPAPASEKSSLQAEKQTITAAIKELEAQLNTREQKEKINTRIQELEDQEGEMADELARLEGVEFAIEQFTKAKMDMLEQRVNGLFQIVRFKMFEDQINGGQSETCVALINGVPFSDANTASKINAGVDIINVLARHFDVYAPIFIDNRESVVNLIDTDCQVINLLVSAKDKKLRVEKSTSLATSN